jgi:hypothetical protein
MRRQSRLCQWAQPLLAGDLTKALPELKHTMIFKRCMGAAPSGGYIVYITAIYLEGLLHYILVNKCTFTVMNDISEHV